MLKSGGKWELVKVNYWKWPRKSRNRKLLKISKITFFFKTSLKNRLITYSSPVQPRRTPKSSKFSHFELVNTKSLHHILSARVLFFLCLKWSTFSRTTFFLAIQKVIKTALSLCFFFSTQITKTPHEYQASTVCDGGENTRLWTVFAWNTSFFFCLKTPKKIGNETLWQGW